MNILNLPDWEETNYTQSKNEYTFHVRYTVNPSVCLQCGVMFPRLQGFGRKHQEYKDLTIHGKRVVLMVERRRFRCQECNKTFYEQFKDLDEKRRATVRFVEYVAEKALSRTFTSIAEELGIDEKTVRNIFYDHIKDLEKRFVFVTPRWLGIDELHLIKPRGILTNIEERTMFDMLEDRLSKTVIKRLRAIPDKDKVELVSIDMWRPYLDAVKVVLPKAIVIIDKFHVVKMVNQALESVRKKVRGELTDKQRRSLMHDRYILLRRKKDLKPENLIILETWLARFPQLKSAYQLKEQFYEIWDTATASADARRRYAEWQANIPDTLSWAFAELEKSIENWNDEIFAYFDHRITNAYTEALNGLAKIANRTGRGYSFTAIRAKMLFSFGVQKKPKKKGKVIMEERKKYKDKEHEEIVSLGAELEMIFKEIGIPVEQVLSGDISTAKARYIRMKETLESKSTSTQKPKPSQKPK